MISLKCHKNALFHSESVDLKQHLACVVQFVYSNQNRGFKQYCRLYGRQIPYDCTPFGCNETRMHAIPCEKKDRVYFVPDTFDQAEKEGFVQCSHVLGVQMIMKGHF